MAFEWQGLVKSIAPTLATALGGPLAGQAVRLMANSLLGPGTADGKSNKQLSTLVGQALETATPEQLAALKRVDNDFEVQMKELEVDLVEIATKDKQDARNLAIKKGLGPQVALSCIFIIGYFSVMYMLLTGQVNIHPGLKDVVLVLIGILTANIPKIMEFWFGSSAGSKSKTDALIQTIR